MDKQNIIDNITVALRTEDVTKTEGYSYSSEYLTILQKTNYSNESRVREFLRSLKEILVFGGFFNKNEIYFHNRESFDYKVVKSKVLSFTLTLIEESAFLPVDPTLWDAMILRLINDYIKQGQSKKLALIFNEDLKAISPNLFMNENIADY